MNIRLEGQNGLWIPRLDLIVRDFAYRRSDRQLIPRGPARERAAYGGRTSTASDDSISRIRMRCDRRRISEWAFDHGHFQTSSESVHRPGLLGSPSILVYYATFSRGIMGLMLPKGHLHCQRANRPRVPLWILYYEISEKKSKIFFSLFFRKMLRIT